MASERESKTRSSPSEREQDQFGFAMLCFCVDVGGDGRKEIKGFSDGMK